MTTDFNYNNKTIDSGGPIKPSGTDQPGDPRTRVDFYSDIKLIPNPYVGMIITVKTDETNQNKMTDYKVLSLKANTLGIANSVIDRVQRYVEYLGASSGGSVDLSGYATKDELNTKANTSDIPTNTSELYNDSGFLTSIPSEYVTETEMNEAIANVSSGGSVSQEDINTAVNNYLTEHPVSSGATAEQASQIQANKTAIGDANSGLIKEVNKIPSIESNLSNIKTLISSLNELKTSFISSNEPMVMFIFDDLNGTTYRMFNEVFKPRGIAFTAALRMDSCPEYSIIREMQDGGCEIACHGYAHDNNISTVPDDIKRYLDKASLEQLNTFGYVGPSGFYDERIIFHDNFESFKWTRSGCASRCEDIPSPSLFCKKVQSCFIDDMTTNEKLEQAKVAIDDLADYGTGYLCFSSHIWKNYDYLIELVDYILSKNISIKTVIEAYETYGAIFEVYDDRCDLGANGFNSNKYPYFVLRKDGTVYSNEPRAVKTKPLSFASSIGREGDYYVDTDKIYIKGKGTNNWKYIPYSSISNIPEVIPSTTLLKMNNGQSSTFNIGLNLSGIYSVPVTITPSSEKITVDHSSVTLTSDASTSGAAQTITVTASDDCETGIYTIDVVASGVTKIIRVRLINNNQNYIILSNSILSINEGESGSFEVKLSSEPTVEEVINLSVDNSYCTISPTQLTFNSTNYSTEQIVTINTAADTSSYNNKTSVITLSNDNMSNKTLTVNILNTDIKEELEVESIELNKETSSLNIGETETLTYTLSPEGVASTVTWSTDKDSVATVNNGEVRGISVGIAIITATTDNNKTDSCTFTIMDNTVVTDPDNLFTESCLNYTIKGTENGRTGYYKKPEANGTIISYPFDSSKGYTIKATLYDYKASGAWRVVIACDSSGVQLVGATMVNNGDNSYTYTINADAGKLSSDSYVAIRSGTHDILIYDISIREK